MCEIKGILVSKPLGCGQRADLCSMVCEGRIRGTILDCVTRLGLRKSDGIM